MPFPKRETVFERSKRNGGFISGREHPMMQRLGLRERQEDAIEATTPDLPKEASAPAAVTCPLCEGAGEVDEETAALFQGDQEMAGAEQD
jgi:hypothetical protein